MHINAHFICTVVSQSAYYRFDEYGQQVSVPLYLATASLLPIAFECAHVKSGGSWWYLQRAHHARSFIELYVHARARGVTTIIISPDEWSNIQALPAVDTINLEVVVVPDCTTALLDTARAWRLQCMVPLIAVAGSIGKTTAIDMLCSIFGVDKLPILVSNSYDHSITHLASCVLHITDKHVAAVFEVGTLSVGDMRVCAELLRPTLALITAVCPAHLREMSDLRMIAQEKQQIFSFFSPSQIGIVCGDYAALTTHAYEHPIVRFGLKNKNSITARKVLIFKDSDGVLKTKIILRVYDYEQEIILPGHHRALVYGALAASALAYFLYIPFDIIVKGLKQYMPVQGQFDMLSMRDGRGIIINDNHSISPDSVKAALHAIHVIEEPVKKIAVLGNIPDLGSRESFWHRHVGRELIKTRSISNVILVGDATRSIRFVAPATMDIWLAPEWDDAQKTLDSLLLPAGNLVLLSGAAPSAMNQLILQLI
jgi:UDP-N-acetylmuramyl pentapeptide synthase